MSIKLDKDKANSRTTKKAKNNAVVRSIINTTSYSPINLTITL